MKRYRHLTLVVSNAAPASIDGLLKQYSAANERWQASRAEPDRIAARDAYNAWATAFLGDDAAPLIIGNAQHWGFR